MTTPYVLLADAEADFRDIIRHTRKRWGTAQARVYVAKLMGCIDALVSGHARSKAMDSLYAGLRVLRCERHLIFCLVRADAPVTVVALFHERMNLMARLIDRLG